MKKIMKPFVLVAAAAMALASCQKNEISAPEKQDVHFTINAGIETKTSIVEGKDEENKTVYTAQWDGNEVLGVLFEAPKAETTASNVVRLTNAVSGRTASFQGNVTLDPIPGTFYAFYPAEAFNRGYGEGDARLDLKNVQKPTATSFDPSCDILVAKPYDYEVVGGKVVADGLEFARLMSVLRIDLKSEFADIQNEFVESVSFTAGDVEITGYARVFLNNPKFDKWESNGAKWCTVTANYDSDLVSINGTSNSVYLVIAPVTIPANKDLTFEIKTKNYNISKTIKSPEMKFTAGKVSKINLTIAADNCDKIDTSIDYSGEYLIVGKEGEKWYAAKKYTSGKYLAVSEIEFVGENIIETETISDHYMTIEKVFGGDYDGMYTIVDAGGKYLSTSSSTSNDMEAVESASKDTYWTIVKDDAKGSYSIVASKSQYSRNDMRFNYNNGTNSRVSCYDGSKTNLPYFTLFSTSLVKPDTTPKIIVENTSFSVKATDTSVEIPYNVKNITGTISANVADGATISNIKTNVTDGKVTISFAANDESAEKTATIVLSYEGAQDVNVVITQEAAGATKQYYVKVTSAPTDWSGTYLIVAGTSVATVIDGSWMKYVTTTINDNKIEATATINAYAVTVAKVTSQSYYTIKLANGQYLGTPSSNGIKQSATVGTDFYWKFSISSNLVKIEANAYSGRILRLNGTSGFRTYTTSTGTQATLYRLENGESGGETPEPDEPETPEAVTLKSIAVSGQKTAYNVGDAFVKPTVTATYSDESTKPVTDAAVFNGYDLSAAGTQTVTVQYTEEGVTVSTTYSITVTGATATKSWKLVTDASTLKSGDKLAIVSTSKGKIASATISSSIMGELSVTITNNSFATLPSGAAELTLGGSSGAWTLTNASGKKLGATAVKKVAWGSGTTTWAITIASNGDATIQSTTSSYGRFLHNVGSTRFTTYTSAANTSMLLPQLYRYE